MWKMAGSSVAHNMSSWGFAPGPRLALGNRACPLADPRSAIPRPGLGALATLLQREPAMVRIRFPGRRVSEGPGIGRCKQVLI